MRSSRNASVASIARWSSPSISTISTSTPAHKTGDDEGLCTGLQMRAPDNIDRSKKSRHRSADPKPPSRECLQQETRSRGKKQEAHRKRPKQGTKEHTSVSPRRRVAQTHIGDSAIARAPDNTDTVVRECLARVLALVVYPVLHPVLGVVRLRLLVQAVAAVHHGILRHSEKVQRASSNDFRTCSSCAISGTLAMSRFKSCHCYRYDFKRRSVGATVDSSLARNRPTVTCLARRESAHPHPQKCRKD